MKKEQFKKDYIIGPQQVDEKGRLSFHSLLSLMTEAHISYAQLYGMPIEELIKRGYTYVIQKEELSSEGLIYKGQKLSIYPFIKGISKSSIIRGALIKDEGENTIGRYTAIVKVIDRNSRKKVDIPEFIFSSFDICKALEKEMPFDRIPEVKDAGYTEDFPVLISDLDINNHVTHSRYLKWALEKTPMEILSSKCLRKVKIVFLKEIFLGDRVTLNMKIVEEEMGKETITIHQIKNSKGDSAAAIKCIFR